MPRYRSNAIPCAGDAGTAARQVGVHGALQPRVIGNVSLSVPLNGITQPGKAFGHVPLKLLITVVVCT